MTEQASYPGAERAEGRVTVVIPAYNEERWIRSTLAATLAQCDVGLAFDVIVVDTGSTDSTCEFVGAYPVTLIRVEQRSSYIARNAGLAASRASHFAFLDADCIPQPDWLNRLLEAARAGSLDYVAGRIENTVVVDNVGNRILALRTSPEVRRNNVLRNSVAAGNMLIHRRVFDRIGLFAPVQSGGDILQSQRASDAGFSIGYAEQAVARHQCDLSNIDYLKRRHRIRRGQVATSGVAHALIDSLRGVPWRPGISEALRLANAIEKSRVVVFIFLWAERWAEWVGVIRGGIDCRRLVANDPTRPKRVDA